MTSSVPVLVVDDDALMGDAIVALLRAEGIQARAFTSGSDMFDNLPDVPCACIISDVVMPNMDGGELLKRLTAEKGKSWPVILITAHGQVSMAVELMKAGAADFIQKPVEADVLVPTVMRCIDACLGEAAAVVERQQAALKVSHLTWREEQVYRRLVEGASNKSIASELGLSPRTVELFRARVMQKMGVQSLAALVKLRFATETYEA